MKQRVLRGASVILLIAVMAAVFMFSAQPAEDSQATSDGFFFSVVSLFYPEIKTMTETERQELLERFSAPIRKTAHFSIFGLMGVFSLLSFVSYKIPRADFRSLAAWLLCVAYSVGDEIHQSFIPGRSCELRDMIIDSTGAFLGAAAALYICCFTAKKRKEGLR